MPFALHKCAGNPVPTYLVQKCINRRIYPTSKQWKWSEDHKTGHSLWDCKWCIQHKRGLLQNTEEYPEIKLFALDHHHDINSLARAAAMKCIICKRLWPPRQEKRNWISEEMPRGAWEVHHAVEHRRWPRTFLFAGKHVALDVRLHDAGRVALRDGSDSFQLISITTWNSCDQILSYCWLSWISFRSQISHSGTIILDWLIWLLAHRTKMVGTLQKGT